MSEIVAGLLALPVVPLFFHAGIVKNQSVGPDLSRARAREPIGATMALGHNPASSSALIARSKAARRLRETQGVDAADRSR
jgi:hypothetical protein